MKDNILNTGREVNISLDDDHLIYEYTMYIEYNCPYNLRSFHNFYKNMNLLETFIENIFDEYTPLRYIIKKYKKYQIVETIYDMEPDETWIEVIPFFSFSGKIRYMELDRFMCIVSNNKDYKHEFTPRYIALYKFKGQFFVPEDNGDASFTIEDKDRIKFLKIPALPDELERHFPYLAPLSGVICTTKSVSTYYDKYNEESGYEELTFKYNPQTCMFCRLYRIDNVINAQNIESIVSEFYKGDVTILNSFGYSRSTTDRIIRSLAYGTPERRKILEIYKKPGRYTYQLRYRADQFEFIFERQEPVYFNLNGYDEMYKVFFIYKIMSSNSALSLACDIKEISSETGLPKDKIADELLDEYRFNHEVIKDVRRLI